LFIARPYPFRVDDDEKSLSTKSTSDSFPSVSFETRSYPLQQTHYTPRLPIRRSGQEIDVCLGSSMCSWWFANIPKYWLDERLITERFLVMLANHLAFSEWGDSIEISSNGIVALTPFSPSPDHDVTSSTKIEDVREPLLQLPCLVID